MTFEQFIGWCGIAVCLIVIGYILEAAAKDAGR